MTTVDEAAEVQQPFSPLVAAVLTQMVTDRNFTTNALIDNYKAQLLSRDAELYAIRAVVSQLLEGPYMPMPGAIYSAVFNPRSDLIEKYKANKEVGW